MGKKIGLGAVFTAIIVLTFTKAPTLLTTSLLIPYFILLNQVFKREVGK